MRSRFTAFALGLFDYIQDTMEGVPAEEFDRTSAEEQHEVMQWTRLEILKVQNGSESDSQGVVEFIAHFLVDGSKGSFREESFFEKRSGRWFYVAGKHRPV
jgi:SEC-C motif-containing protein